MVGTSALKTIVSRNPANREVLGETAISAKEDIYRTTDRARAAFEHWKNVPLRDRLEKVEQFRKLLMKERENVAALITRECGKPFGEALISDVFGILETCTWLKRKAPRLLGGKHRTDLNPIFFTGKKSYNIHEPLGVVAVISPWNYPFSIPAASLLMALVAGNAVILKPSPRCPLVATELVNMLIRAGFPADLVGLVQGDKEEAEALILSGVNRVIFTGSVQGGKAIMQIAAKKLIPVTLELGGKHPAIVLDDADPAKIAGAITWCAFTNAGQACASIDRLYVHRSVADNLLARIIEATKKLRMGDGMSPVTDIGPIIDDSQMKRFEQVVTDAVAKGAKLVAGGKPRTDLGGYFFEPTIVTNVDSSMLLADEEIFGPILPVTVFDTVDQAVAMANNSELGLAASIWTGAPARGEELAKQIEAGIVWINDGLYSHVCPDAPWGGVKYSGFGRAHSSIELLDFVNIKNIGVSRQGTREWHFPYSRQSLDYLLDGMELIHGESVASKAAALTRIVRSRVQMFQ